MPAKGADAAASSARARCRRMLGTSRRAACCASLACGFFQPAGTQLPGCDPSGIERTHCACLPQARRCAPVVPCCSGGEASQRGVAGWMLVCANLCPARCRACPPAAPRPCLPGAPPSALLQAAAPGASQTVLGCNPVCGHVCCALRDQCIVAELRRAGQAYQTGSPTDQFRQKVGARRAQLAGARPPSSEPLAPCLSCLTLKTASATLQRAWAIRPSGSGLSSRCCCACCRRLSAGPSTGWSGGASLSTRQR